MTSESNEHAQERVIGKSGEEESRSLLPAANVLLVDDRPENLLALRAILEDAGYNLVEARSGEAALRCVLAQDFAVILMDVQMPGMSGFETARLIKTRGHSKLTPIIFLTAINQEDAYVFQGYDVGAVDYLFKPFDPHVLRSKVAVFVELFLSRRRIWEQNLALQALSESLHQANERLKEADRVKDEFLSVISHELRTPLNFIMGFASLLEDAACLEVEDRQHVAGILRGADRMLMLVNDLLDYAKIQAGKLSLLPEPTPYVPLVEEVVATLLPLARQKDITLASRLDVPVTPVLDARRIAQVLMNLVANAIKFTPPGGHVTVEATVADGAIMTTVADTGPGIAPDDLPKLFVRFKQLNMSATREAGGTGLGLAIAKQFVEAHGGTIGVESTLARGSSFWFKLPLSAPEV